MTTHFADPQRSGVPHADGDSIFRAGIDLGTSSLKMVVLDATDQVVVREQVETPWVHGPGGTAWLEAEAFSGAIRELVGGASEAAKNHGISRISALGVAGMGETGMIVDPAGTPVGPAMAWFDPRGADQVNAFSRAIGEQFAGRTGLPFGAQASVAKIAYLRDHGVSLENTQWLNLPEFVVTLLGGDRGLEYSLTSRTGLLDQDTAKPWGLMMEALGVDESFFPPLRHGGDSWGFGSSDCGPVLEGAALTVAGHDHLVAAHASGMLSPESYFVSMGTAEVLLRIIDEPLGFDARGRLADALINEVHHVVPGKRVLVAGLKTGLVLGRALRVIGITDRSGRDRMDEDLSGIDWDTFVSDPSIEVSGARNDDGVLAFSLHSDAVSPTDLIAALIHHTNQEVLALCVALDREIPRATTTTLSGGWAGMAALRKARAAILPNVSVAPEVHETAFGAALATKPHWGSSPLTIHPATQERHNTA